jgi:phospholipid transport system substrate-binding protein
MIALVATLLVAPATGPMGMLKNANDELRVLLRRPKDGQADRMRKIVGGFLDYEELGRRSLAGHWDKLSAADRQAFLRVFRDLIERNYLRQLGNNADFQIDYRSEKLAGGEATVQSVVLGRHNGRATETTVDYRLLQKNDSWLVYDVITDDVSLLRNYRSEFGRIITRDGFSALLGKMKAKLAE